MKHDPKSFQAGLCVGVSLRGWATAGTGSAVIDSVSLKAVKIPTFPPIVPVAAVAAALAYSTATIHCDPLPVLVFSFEEVSA